MCRESGVREVWEGQSSEPACACVLLSILICCVAAGGRLVLVAVCVCVIRRCSGLFLISSLQAKLLAYTLQVFLWKITRHKGTSVCLCVPLRMGGEGMHVLETPLHLSCGPHCDKLEGNDKRPSFYGIKLAEGASSVLFQVPRLH